MTAHLAPPLHNLLAMRWWIVGLFACVGCKRASNEAVPIALGSATSPYPSVELPGDCNGIVWDASAHALYLTDDTHNQLQRWTDAGGFAVFASLPASKRPALGGLAELTDGSFVAASLGFGDNGAVFQASAKGEAKALDHMDPARRRLGVASDGAGGWYEAYFVVSDGKHHGGVAHVGADGIEHELVGAPLAKPVGLAATATTLYIADQEAKALFAMTLQSGELRPIAQDLGEVDLLTLMPNGDLVTGGAGGTVVRISAAGKVTKVAEGFAHVRGTAYDPAGKRLFVIDHARATSNHELHIVPLEP
jgi:sugar lactone lactonase YvrE